MPDLGGPKAAFKPAAGLRHLICGLRTAVWSEPAAPFGGAIPLATDEDRRAEERGLVDRAQTGDMAAFEELYRRNVGRVYALCMRMAGDASLAEELAQDVFVRAWERLGTFRGESAFSSWLHPLTVNVALSERRARRRRTSRVDDHRRPDAVREARQEPRGPRRGWTSRGRWPRCPRARGRCSCCTTWRVTSHQEIAEMTGVAEGTSKAQLHRARRMMREALET